MINFVSALMLAVSVSLGGAAVPATDATPASHSTAVAHKASTTGPKKAFHCKWIWLPLGGTAPYCWWE